MAYLVQAMTHEGETLTLRECQTSKEAQEEQQRVLRHIDTLCLYKDVWWTHAYKEDSNDPYQQRTRSSD